MIVTMVPGDTGSELVASTLTAELHRRSRFYRGEGLMSVMAFYEKVIKVKADVAAFLINCFPSA